MNPNAIRAMNEVGIDISKGTPKSVQQFVSQSFDYVITVCDDADRNCPTLPAKSASESTLDSSIRPRPQVPTIRS